MALYLIPPPQTRRSTTNPALVDGHPL